MKVDAAGDALTLDERTTSKLALMVTSYREVTKTYLLKPFERGRLRWSESLESGE